MIYRGRGDRTFDITCPDGAPEVGREHALNGYTFRETLHGPMRWGTCVDCGKPALEIQPTGIATDAVATDTRCDSCGRARYGAALSYYETGRDLLYRTIAPFEPHRRDPTRGGLVELADLLAEVRDRALPAHERSARCARCAGIIDPAARTIEHPDVHPTCVPDWTHIPAHAPMERALPDEAVTPMED